MFKSQSSKLKTYRISELIPFINWLYFYHAWGLSGKPKADKEKIKQEALQMLASWEVKYHTHAIFKLFEVGSEGDDLIFFLPSTSEENGISGTSGGNGTPGTSGIESNGIEEKKEKNLRFPMLRQQHPSAPGEPNLCLADLGNYRSAMDAHCRIEFTMFCRRYANLLPSSCLDEMIKEDGAVKQLDYLCKACLNAGQKIMRLCAAWWSI